MVLEGVKEMWTELPKTGKGKILCYENFFNLTSVIQVFFVVSYIFPITATLS